MNIEEKVDMKENIFEVSLSENDLTLKKNMSTKSLDDAKAYRLRPRAAGSLGYESLAKDAQYLRLKKTNIPISPNGTTLMTSRIR